MSGDPAGRAVGDPGVPSRGGDATARDQVNSWLAAINPVTSHLVAERTSYSSQLIPVTPYVTVSCIEAFLRYPEAVATIATAMPPEEIGAAARRPGCQADSVFLWGVANFFLLGRNVMAMVDPSLDSLERTHTVLDFWARASHAYRDGPHLHAAEVGNRVDVLPSEMVAHLAAGATGVGEERRDRIRRANATIINHLFLLYFDTRVGHADNGPYRLEDGRTLIVRDFYRLGQSDFSWSGVAAGVPYRNLTAALVLDPQVEVSINDKGFAVSAGRASIAGKLVDATYPAYRRVLRFDHSSSLEIQSTEWDRSIRAAGSASDGKTRAVRLELDADRCEAIGSAADGGRSVEPMEGSYSGPEIVTGVNLIYAQSIAKIFGPTPKLTLGFGTAPGDLIMITSDDRPGVIAGVMPMRA